MSEIVIAPIGVLKLDPESGWHVSSPVAIPLLRGREVVFVVEGCVGDDSTEQFGRTIRNLLAAEPAVLKSVAEDVYHYFLDANDNVYRDEEDRLEVGAPEDVWEFVEFGDEIHIERRVYGDQRVYASFLCECEWEEEHGLLIVLRDGSAVCRVGPYDGHLTNSDAYDDESLEDVVYIRLG